MNKILITGYEHSGTTMLMNLLRSHPQVGWIENEMRYIEYDKPKEWVVMFAKTKVFNLKEKCWGEKIPWGLRPEDNNAKRPINFTKKWIKYFGKESRVLHILRHPIDVSLSGKLNSTPSKQTLKQISITVPKYIEYINNNSYSATIVYEDLLMNPKEHLHNIFNFCDLMSTEKILNVVTEHVKIKSERAFAFEKKGIESEVEYNSIKDLARVKL